MLRWRFAKVIFVLFFSLFIVILLKIQVIHVNNENGVKRVDLHAKSGSLQGALYTTYLERLS